MHRQESTFDIVFGIGFKIGFLIVIVGMFLFYMPFLDRAVSLTFDYIGFWDKFQTFPVWIKFIIGGFMLVGTAVVIGTLKEFIENLVNSLFGEKEY